jgi:hypothetical protein
MLTTWLSNAAGEIDLSETSIAAIWKIPPFIRGRPISRRGVRRLLGASGRS